MFAFLALLVAAPVQTPPVAQADSLAGEKRRPVTAEVVATAFRDPVARTMLLKARATRMAHDSTLASYDARVRTRVSFGVAVGRWGRERLVYRQESAARVQWQRDVGARVEMTGMRAVAPVLSGEIGDGIDDVHTMASGSEASPIPYFPGSESMWIGMGAARAQVSEDDMIHPMAEGAEAYYTYRSGDSVSFTLPDGRVIGLRELEVRPRRPAGNVAVGSLWLDAASGQLVRAAYRLATPIDMAVGVSPSEAATNSRTTRALVWAIKGLMSPNRASLTGVTVEYGLYQGRFWLPRQQTAEGFAEVSLARVPVEVQHAFSYASVNSDLAMAPIVVDTTPSALVIVPPPDSLDVEARRRWRDSTLRVYRAADQAQEDSVLKGMRVGDFRQCDTASVILKTRYRYGKARVPVELRLPCTKAALIDSPDFEHSIYDDDDVIISASERDELLGAALDMAAQAGLFSAFPRPRISLGPTQMRYNRVEGFSAGLLVEQQLGGGYTASALGRYGTADGVVSGELSVARTNLSRTARLTAYSRLASANDWGEPLTFRASVPALLFGRDEGFYYRTRGAELRWNSTRGLRLDWRAFAERQRDAPVHSTWSMSGDFGANVVAAPIASYGAAVRFQHDLGDDPLGFRMTSTVRLEGAGGDSVYGRSALDLTFADQFFSRVGATLMLSGGSSAGSVPPQRRWFLGGSRTIRGQDPDTAQSGNAYWMARLELGTTLIGARPMLFGDVGWVGDRSRVATVGRPLSGVGIGASFLDGLIRLDVARGLYPRKQTRVLFYLDAPF